MWLRSSVFPREARSRLQKRGNFHISLKLFFTGLVRRDEYTGGEENTRTRGGKSGGKAQLTVLHLIGKLKERIFEIIKAIRGWLPVSVGPDGRHGRESYDRG